MRDRHREGTSDPGLLRATVVTPQLTKWRRGEVTYQFQSVDMILLDIVHYVSVSHPFGNGGKRSAFHVSVNTGKLQDVRVRQSAPEYDFLAELLEQNRSVHTPRR